MSKISKAVAHEVAIKICSKLDKKIEVLEKELKTKVDEIRIMQLPEGILDMYDKNKNYFYVSSGIHLYGNGFNRYWVNGLKLLPYCTDNGGNFEPTKEGAKILHVIVDKLEDLKLKRKQSILEIENTLIALGSYKKIQVEMPETFKYLPSNGVSTALMLNVAPINEKINCLISGDEKCLGKI